VPAGCVHDAVNIGMVYLVGEADALHGQVQPLQRHRVKLGSRSSTGA
jgi:hypothetical protein